MTVYGVYVDASLNNKELSEVVAVLEMHTHYRFADSFWMIKSSSSTLELADRLSVLLGGKYQFIINKISGRTVLSGNDLIAVEGAKWLSENSHNEFSLEGAIYR
ncbi:hypothetical protein VCHA55O508_40067 [Vibrio chagasii]|nr:hypothetical protein VCHA28FP16_10792 [Vibrio chagasii]CAH7455352.1 hypothetical protein VCHA55O508_40067 [Vibrio chagasii]